MYDFLLYPEMSNIIIIEISNQFIRDSLIYHNFIASLLTGGKLNKIVNYKLLCVQPICMHLVF